MHLNAALSILKSALQSEHEAGRINSLDELAASQLRREMISRQWQAIQAALASAHQQIKDLPDLPPEEQILWAQLVLAMRDLAFMEIDTTGLGEQDEIIRFTLVDSNLNTIDDFLIQPTTSQLSEEASHINGIRPEQLEREGLPIAQAWERIQAALVGRYVVSYSQEWDIKQLKAMAKRHNLPPVLIIGADLQRHTTLYYHREYYLSLAELCERIGHPLPKQPNQASLDRAKGQAHILTAMAKAVTDVRPTKDRKAPTGDEADIDADFEHPF